MGREAWSRRRGVKSACHALALYALALSAIAGHSVPAQALDSIIAAEFIHPALRHPLSIAGGSAPVGKVLIQAHTWGRSPTSEVMQAMPAQAPRQTRLSRPPLGNFPLSGPRPTGSGQFSLGGVRNIPLNEQSVSVRIPLDEAGRRWLGSILREARKSGNAKTVDPTVPAPTVQLVLDGIRITAIGEAGGYFYNVYLNLPAVVQTAALEQKHFLGEIGPFSIAGALHQSGKHDDHARRSVGPSSGSARLVFPATRLLAHLLPAEVTALTVSLVRVSGDHAPVGEIISIGEMRLELSVDDLE